MSLYFGYEERSGFGVDGGLDMKGNQITGLDLLRGRCGICRGPRAYRGLALYCATPITPRTRPFSIKTPSFLNASQIWGRRANVGTSHIQAWPPLRLASWS